MKFVKWVANAALLSVLVVPAVRANAALEAYMAIKGQKSGDVKGSVTQKGREGKIAVIAVSHEIISPRDPASGLPTGKRMHKPLVVTVEWDKASPILRTMLSTNENLTSVEIQFWTPQIRAATGTGAEVNYMTIKLTNANIASIKTTMPNVLDPSLAKYPVMDEIAFTYQSITMTYTDGGIMYQDSWSGSNAEAPQTGHHTVARQTPDKARTGKSIAKLTRIAARPVR